MAKSVGSVEVQVGAKIDALQTELRKARGEVEKLTATHKREMAKAAAATKPVEQAISEVGKSASRSAGMIQKLGIATAAAGAATIAFSRNALMLAGDIVDTSNAIGIGVERYQEWQQAASLAGVKQSEFNTAMLVVRRNIGDAARGVGTAADKFNGLGIAVRDAQGNVRSVEEVVRDLSDVMSRTANETEKASIAGEVFGNRNRKIISLLGKGNVELKAQEENVRKLGLVMSAGVANSLEEADDNLAAFNRSLQIVGATILSDALGPMQSMIKLFLDIRQSSGEAGAALQRAFSKNDEMRGTIDEDIRRQQELVKRIELIRSTTTAVESTNRALDEANRKLADLIAARELFNKSAARGPDVARKSADAPMLETFQRGATGREGSTSRQERLRGIFDARAAARARVAEEQRLRSGIDYSTGRPDLRNARRGVDEVREASTEAIDELNRATDNFRVNLTDSLITGATEGFDGMLAGFSRTLQQMASDLLSSQLLRLLSSVGGGSSGGGALGFLGKIGGAIAGVFGGTAGATAGASAGSGSAMSAFFPGFATGGEFKVGGSGGTDSQLVAFRASPDETVSVRRPDQMQTAGATINNNVTVNGNPDGATLMAFKRALADNSRATIAQIAEMQRRGRFA